MKRNPELNKANINLQDAKTVYDRQKKVYEQGVIPLADFQRYKVTYDNASEEVESAESNLQLIRDGVNKKMGTNNQYAHPFNNRWNGT